MVQIYVGIGSNIDREKNISGGITELKKKFESVIVSPVYECASCGFEGADFLNLVAGFETEQDIEQVSNSLRDIEFRFGRKRSQERFSSRTLDIDILLYGDYINAEKGIPRADIVDYDFVLKPFVDIAPDLIHPQMGKKLSSLWSDFDKSNSKLTRILMNFEG